MIVSSTLSPTAAQTTAQSAAQTSTLAASGNANSGSSFVAALVSASAAQPGSSTNTANNAHRSFRSGQLSIDMHADGQRINGVSYFDEAGQKLTTSGFWPQDILRNCERFNIPLSDLQGLGPQLDAAGVRYKPYEQYAGTGSNHGIDLDDLASGGMGTAYDWTQDALVHLKGPSARAQLQADQALAQRLGLAHRAEPTQVAGSTTQAAAAANPANAATLAASGASSNSNTSATPASAAPDTSIPSALSALDELIQLITQVKHGLNSSSSGAAVVPSTLATPSTTTPSSALPTTTAVGNAAPASPASGALPLQEAGTNQRLAQMKTLLEQLLAQR